MQQSFQDVSIVNTIPILDSLKKAYLVKIFRSGDYKS